MSRILELQNPANFSLQYSSSIPATITGIEGNRYIYAPLVQIEIPIIFTNPCLSIAISTSIPIGRIWRYAGTCNKIISSALGDSYAEGRKPLFLGKRNLIYFDGFDSDYQLSYLPPNWFFDVSIGIYQYEGSDISREEIINDGIQEKLDNIYALLTS